MKNNFKNTILPVVSVLIATAFTGCIKDIDLDQAEEFELYTTQDLDLVHFSITQDNFNNVNTGNLETVFIQERGVVDFFDEEFFRQNLKEVNFVFGAESTFSQSMLCNILFLDPQNQELYAVDFRVQGSPDGSSVFSEQSVLINEADLEQFKSAPFRKIDFSFELIENGLPVEGSLDFRSKALYTIKLD